MAKISSKYLELIRSFPLRRIRSEAELDRAEAMLHQLMDAPSLSAAEVKGIPITPKMGRVLFSELADAVVADCRMNKRNLSMIRSAG